MTINTEWHEKNKMPKNAQLDQKIRWHELHARVCGCKPIPPAIEKEIEERFQNLPMVKNFKEQASQISKLMRDAHKQLVDSQKSPFDGMTTPIPPPKPTIIYAPTHHQSSDRVEIFLTSTGDLYRKPKQRYIYRLQAKMRLDILKLLIDSEEYMETSDIRIKSKSTSNDSVRNAIGMINKNATSKLGLDRNLISHKQSSGYRIDPNYEIILVKE